MHVCACVSVHSIRTTPLLDGAMPTALTVWRWMRALVCWQTSSDSIVSVHNVSEIYKVNRSQMFLCVPVLRETESVREQARVGCIEIVISLQVATSWNVKNASVGTRAASMDTCWCSCMFMCGDVHASTRARCRSSLRRRMWRK